MSFGGAARARLAAGRLGLAGDGGGAAPRRLHRDAAVLLHFPLELILRHALRPGFFPTHGGDARETQGIRRPEGFGSNQANVAFDGEHDGILRVVDPHVGALRRLPGDEVHRGGFVPLARDAHVWIELASKLAHHLRAHARAHFGEGEDAFGIRARRGGALDDAHQVLGDLAPAKPARAVESPHHHHVQVLGGKIVGLKFDPPLIALAGHPLRVQILAHEPLLLSLDAKPKLILDVAKTAPDDAIRIGRIVGARRGDVQHHATANHAATDRTEKHTPVRGIEREVVAVALHPGGFPTSGFRRRRRRRRPGPRPRPRPRLRRAHQRLEHGRQNLMALSKRPIDHGVVLVVQHVEGDVHEFELAKEKRSVVRHRVRGDAADVPENAPVVGGGSTRARVRALVVHRVEFIVQILKSVVVVRVRGPGLGPRRALLAAGLRVTSVSFRGAFVGTTSLISVSTFVYGLHE